MSTDPDRLDECRSLTAAAELRQVNLTDALSPLLLIREAGPSSTTGGGAVVREVRRRQPHLLLRACASLVDLLDGLGRHDRVAVVRLERWLRAPPSLGQRTYALISLLGDNAALRRPVHVGTHVPTFGANQPSRAPR